MNRRHLARFVPHLTGTVLGATLIAAVVPLPTLLLWNASPSAPIGLYRVNPLREPAVGDMIAINPPPTLARFMAERHYLPVGIPLLKYVAARPGALICRRDAAVTIDGRIVAIAKAADSRGRPLPVWHGCRRIPADEMFLLNGAPDSFDGRYFGSIPASGMLGRATPILTRNTPDAPLRRRFGCVPDVLFTTSKGEVPCR